MRSTGAAIAAAGAIGAISMAVLSGCAPAAPGGAFDIAGTWVGVNYQVFGSVDAYVESEITFTVEETNGRGFVATVTYDNEGDTESTEVWGVVPEVGRFALLDNDDGVSSIEIVDGNTINYCYKSIDIDLANCAALHRQ